MKKNIEYQTWVKNKYRKIVFAILDDHNAHQSHNPKGNLKPFADEFTKRDV